MQCVAIVGVGLIGGSLGLAIREAGFSGRILGVSSPGSIDEAIRRGAIDEALPLAEAAAQADLVYLAQPIGVILQTLGELKQHLRPGSLVTDAGSTKTAIVKRAHSTIGADRFLGGHPLAGKESRGVEFAEASLFRGRSYVLTPSEDADLRTPVARAFSELLEHCGARLVVTTPEHHDQVVALTSHLPQVLSTTLSALLSERPDSDLEMSGPGLMDMTRLAMSSWDIWKDIVETNSFPLEHALDVYLDRLTNLRDNLQTQRLGHEFRTAANMAKRLRDKTYR